MRLAQYVVGGAVQIVEAPQPACPIGGLLVRTEACGLCSGELMAWYMDRKAPHVLGHEVAGVVIESQDSRFPVGARVFPHHHAPCLRCEVCQRGAHVHCPQWKRTRLDPGGMSEVFAVSAENLNDTHLVDDLRPIDAALAEPLACVMKGITRAGTTAAAAVVGAGALGLMHALMLPGATVFETQPQRLERARTLGFEAHDPTHEEHLRFHHYDSVFVCPGSEAAIRLGARLCAPDGKLVLFAPMPPGQPYPFDQESRYFADLTLIHTYSCGPNDTRLALEALRQGKVKAEQVVSDFVSLDELPNAYRRMANAEILKAMVVF